MSSVQALRRNEEEPVLVITREMVEELEAVAEEARRLRPEVEALVERFVAVSNPIQRGFEAVYAGAVPDACQYLQSEAISAIGGLEDLIAHAFQRSEDTSETTGGNR